MSIKILLTRLISFLLRRIILSGKLFVKSHVDETIIFNKAIKTYFLLQLFVVCYHLDLQPYFPACIEQCYSLLYSILTKVHSDTQRLRDLQYFQPFDVYSWIT